MVRATQGGRIFSGSRAAFACGAHQMLCAVAVRTQSLDYVLWERNWIITFTLDGGVVLFFCRFLFRTRDTSLSLNVTTQYLKIKLNSYWIQRAKYYVPSADYSFDAMNVHRKVFAINDINRKEYISFLYFSNNKKKTRQNIAYIPLVLASLDGTMWIIWAKMKCY